MDVTENHSSQRSVGLKNGCQLVVIAEIHRVHHGVTDGHRRVMQGHHQRKIPAQRISESLLQPLQLVWPEPTGGTTAAVAVEQNQPRALNNQLGGSRAETPTQHSLQQLWMIVVTGQQADWNVDMTI
jgi:hypothetical protein